MQDEESKEGPLNAFIYLCSTFFFIGKWQFIKNTYEKSGALLKVKRKLNDHDNDNPSKIPNNKKKLTKIKYCYWRLSKPNEKRIRKILF